MSAAKTGYNERSWAIDLIGHLKYLAHQSNRLIKDAGGEQTLHDEGSVLFPDVLLFGDRQTARILQGWELKMPDTNIDDKEFYDNAHQKANILGLDSFLLWNVSCARLYARDATVGQFIIIKEWNDLNDISTRAAVVKNRSRWRQLASDVFFYLNDLFEGGTLEGRQFIEIYRSGGITAFLMENSAVVTEAIEDAARCDVSFRNEMILWWDKYKAEYGGEKKRERVLAQVVLSNWIGKLLFAQILREKDIRAHSVADIGYDTTPRDALNNFRRLSEQCNFWTIFSNSIGLALLPDHPWKQLKEFNRLLSDLRLGAIDQSQLSQILEVTVDVAVRKLRGQYPTPIELARLLVQLCVNDTENDRVLDPCCGSGTIVRAAAEVKRAAGVSVERTAASVYACDQDPQAIQIATFALAKPEMMHKPIRIFQRDAFKLTPNMLVEFQDPTNGNAFNEELGEFDAIVSNLPFIAQEGRSMYKDVIDCVTSELLVDGQDFSGRADVAAYLPFVFHHILKSNGRLGIIITNAWLGTDWGDSFYNALSRYYIIKSVIASGAGRWFQNSKVVTNIIILDKKATPDQANDRVQFVVLTRPLDELSDEETLHVTAAQIERGHTQRDTMTIRVVSPDRLSQFRNMGLGGNAQFVNCDWVLDLPLVPLNGLFNIRRGERRGNNAMFYPGPNHGIEKEYIFPLAKSPNDFKYLRGRAIKEAFCCTRDLKELRRLDHQGALSWISRFNTPDNVEKLKKAKLDWFQMDVETLTELAMFINYGNRLFVVRLDPPAFVDQRLVRLDARDSVDVELCHALLNSSIGLFIIEGMGFGRGMGALDLNKDRIEQCMHMLDPSKLTTSAIEEIKAAFLPLQRREILEVPDELEQRDRQDFDEVVLRSFGLSLMRVDLYDCLLALLSIRFAAKG